MEHTITYKTEADSIDQLDRILHPLVKKWFYGRFKEYSLPQRYGVMQIHSRIHTLISAPTGATKTLTAFLSILNELVDSAEKGILEDRTYALYISPLKALNYDIEINLARPLREIEEIAGHDLGIRIGTRTGDTTPRERAKMAKQPPHILITTPESLAIMLNVPSYSRHLHNLQWVIIDEIHALAENKRGVHLSLSLERLSHRSAGLCRVGLSATVAPLEEVARFLVGTSRPCTIINIPFLKDLDLQVISPVADLVASDHRHIQDETYARINELVQSHKTTLIFTNTRAATERVVHQLKRRYPGQYYEIGEEPPHSVSSLIGAHHGSLSKEHRFSIENKLRHGRLKCVVCSTSLELGIDIGFIDLVVLLGSPKSTARLLQRVGRSGHQLHATTKGRIIVQDRDDLMECSLMLKEALEGHIDRIHIPTDAADVLTQHILGMALEKTWKDEDAFQLIRQSYCYHSFPKGKFMQILEYLSGEFVDLEQRYVYAKIWHEEGSFGRKGRMTKVIYLTNLGTIADRGGIAVKQGPYQIGVIDEAFLESLRPNDIFVLGGDTYRFLHAKGMVAQVASAEGRRPTVPSWYSEMLPLSYDVAHAINDFRSKLADRIIEQKKKSLTTKWITKYLYVDKMAALAIYNYVKAQMDYSSPPRRDRLSIEYYQKDGKHYAFFLAQYGRRTNEALARGIAYTISRISHQTVEMAVSDHGFYLASSKRPPVERILPRLLQEELSDILIQAIDKSEALKRRFRQCAARAFLILRTYKGKRKQVGRQQVSSAMLLNTIRRIDPHFVILDEARREVLHDVMDVTHARQVMEKLASGAIKTTYTEVDIPSPFAFNLFLRNFSDILSAHDRQEFLRQMHQMVLATISLRRGKKKQAMDIDLPEHPPEPVEYEQLWQQGDERARRKHEKKQMDLREQFLTAAKRINLPADLQYDISQKIENPAYRISAKTQEWVDTLLSGPVPAIWPDSVVHFLKDHVY
ncbi:MAG: ATP-dependent helicase [Nanoarchaeota archaeon]